MHSRKILVIGGAGFIGSYVNKLLAMQGYQTTVLDNLCRGSSTAVVAGKLIVCDFGDANMLSKLFQEERFDAIFHFAAFTDVGESINNPQIYYDNNVIKTHTLLKAMVANGLSNLIFSSSAAIFGKPLKDKIDEEHPCMPINPYGHTKLICEMMLRDFDVGYGLKSSCLRYFNAAGGDPEGLVKIGNRTENNLIPKLLSSIGEDSFATTLFGIDYPTHDGSCIRDYIHIHDLATAHIQAMEQLFLNKKSTAYNLGNSRGYSVKEVIAAVEKITGHPISVIIGDRRPGDPATLIANPDKAMKELGWKLQFRDIEQMIAHAWNSRIH